MVSDRPRYGLIVTSGFMVKHLCHWSVFGFVKLTRFVTEVPQSRGLKHNRKQHKIETDFFQVFIQNKRHLKILTYLF